MEEEVFGLNGYDEPMEGKRKNGSKQPGAVTSNLQGVNLKDGQAMAFRFREDENDKKGEFDVRLPTWEEDLEGRRVKTLKTDEEMADSWSQNTMV